MHCQCLLAALGGIDMGNSGIYRKYKGPLNLIGGTLSVMDPFKTDDRIRDPIRYMGKGSARLIVGIWESYLVLTGGWLVGKVGHLAGEYLVSGVPETLLSLIFVLAALGGSHHIQARGRLAQISWWIARHGRDFTVAGSSSNSPSLEMVWGDQHPETTIFDWTRSVKSIGNYVAYGSGIGLMTWLTVQVRDSKEKRRKEGTCAGHWSVVPLVSDGRVASLQILEQMQQL